MARIMMFHDEVPITRIADLVTLPVLDYSVLPLAVTNPELMGERCDVLIPDLIPGLDYVVTEPYSIQVLENLFAERQAIHCPLIDSNRPPYFPG